MLQLTARLRDDRSKRHLHGFETVPGRHDWLGKIIIAHWCHYVRYRTERRGPRRATRHRDADGGVLVVGLVVLWRYGHIRHLRLRSMVLLLRSMWRRTKVWFS